MAASSQTRVVMELSGWPRVTSTMTECLSWVKSSRNHLSRFTAAFGGKADEISKKADIAIFVPENAT